MLVCRKWDPALYSSEDSPSSFPCALSAVTWQQLQVRSRCSRDDLCSCSLTRPSQTVTKSWFVSAGSLFVPSPYAVSLPGDPAHSFSMLSGFQWLFLYGLMGPCASVLFLQAFGFISLFETFPELQWLSSDLQEQELLSPDTPTGTTKTWRLLGDVSFPSACWMRAASEQHHLKIKAVQLKLMEACHELLLIKVNCQMLNFS